MQYEYTNIYWNLLGLRAFVQAAHWLGKTDEAAAWQKEYDDFLAAFRKAAARDMKTDPHGNRYLPILMDGRGLAAARAMGVLPRRLSRPDLRQGRSAGGRQHGDARSHRARGHGLWHRLGRDRHLELFRLVLRPRLAVAGQRPARRRSVLYAYANHAAPVLDWREEQSLRGEPYKKVGDMPHNWASAEFIRLAVHLLALDRGDELHLLEGMPAQWLGAGHGHAAQRRRHALRPAPPDGAGIKRRRDGNAECPTAGRELQGGRRPSARRQHCRIAPQQGGTMTLCLAIWSGANYRGAV